MMDETEDNNHKTVLVADSDDFYVVALKDGLVQAGFEVLVAADGQQAIDVLKSEKSDAVLLELILPKVNGFEILEFMAKSKKLHKIPVIVMTSLSQASDEEEARNSGAVDFLVKSEISIQDLLDRLNNLFASQ